MQSFHGTEISDLMGFCHLSRLKIILDTCGLYRDVGFGVFDRSKLREEKNSNT